MKRSLTHAALAFLGAALLGALLFATLPLTEPRWLPLLFVLVPAAPLLERWRRWRRNARRSLGLPAGAEVDAEDRNRALLGAGAIVLLVVALAGPRWGAEVREYGHQPAEIVVLLDVSLSMLAEDQGVSRLAAARAEVDTILHRLERERVALVPFAGIAWVQVPLTHDYGAVTEAMLQVNPRDVPAQGTRIAAAIREGSAGMRGTGERYRALVLISDGEDHGGGARDAARAARAAGAEVHAIGVGRGDGAPIPRAGGEAEGATETLRDTLGREVITRKDEALLRELATLGGGTYRPVELPGSAGSALVELLREGNADWLRGQASAKGADRRGGFLLAALVCLILAGRARPRPTPALHAGPVPAGALPLRLGIVVLGLLVLGAVGGCSDRADYASWAAIESLAAQGNVDEALRAMEALPARVRRRGAWSVNRGLLLLQQDPEAAQRAFLEALRRGEPGTRGAALVGLGQALAAQGEWRAAARRFSEALAEEMEDPGREAAEQNLQKSREVLHPPCDRLAPTAPHHSVEQAAEDEADGATEPGGGGGLILCPQRPDVHALALQPGEEMLVDIHFRRLRDAPGGLDEGAQRPPRAPLARLVQADTAQAAREGAAGAREGSIRGQALRAWREGAPPAALADARGDAWTLRLWVRHAPEGPAHRLYLVLESLGDAELRYAVTMHRQGELRRTFLAQWVPLDARAAVGRPDEDSAEDLRDRGAERDWRALLDSLPANGNLPLERALRRTPVDPSASPW